MRSIHTTTTIRAAPDAVWSVVTDLPRYGEWNPFITAIEGELRVGARLRATFSLPGRSPRTFTPVVTAFEPGRRLSWLGRLAVPGLFDGAHTLAVEPSGDGTLFTHGETFRGVLPPLMGRLLAATEHGFAAMNAALTARAEGRPVDPAS